MVISVQYRSLTGLLIVAALLTGCPQPGPPPAAQSTATQPAPAHATTLSPANTLPSPTACQTYIENEKCPCSTLYTLEAWEDMNANGLRDGSDRPLSGIAFDATWNQWEQREVNTCTGYSSKTYYSVGRKTAITDANGKTALFVETCSCDDPSTLDLQIQVSESRGYRLVTRDAWSFGFQHP